MKKLFWLFALLSITTLSAFATDSFENYLKQQMGEYNTYLEEIDREFTSFLKQRWYEQEGEEPEQLLDKPKPVEIPVAKPDAKPKPITLKPKKDPKPKPKPIKKPKPEPEVKKPEPVEPEPVEPKPAPQKIVPPVVVEPKPKPPVVREPAPSYRPSQDPTGIRISFYGKVLDIPFDKKLRTIAKRPINSKSIANWWEAVAQTDYKKSLKYMQISAKKMNIGDWGYVNIVERFAAKLLGDIPERKLMVWFFLNKAGFDTRLGYSKDGVVKVMIPTDRKLFGVPFYTFSGKRYYVVDVFGKQEPTESLYTYNGSYPGAKKRIVFTKMPYPRLGFAGFSRELSFDIDGKKQTIKAIANRYNVAYLNNFPQAELAVYTGATTPEWIDKTILPELKKLVKGKDAKQAVDTILRFVQTAFEYKTDDKQFGREKFLFAEETIFYPYSDCEDRSVLFAYLVRRLTDLDVVMLDFPGHIAAAVNLGKFNTGAVLEYKGKKYTVTDPTYINATAGMVMPRYKNSSPVIIEPEI